VDLRAGTWRCWGDGAKVPIGAADHTLFCCGHIFIECLEKTYANLINVKFLTWGKYIRDNILVESATQEDFLFTFIPQLLLSLCRLLIRLAGKFSNSSSKSHIPSISGGNGTSSTG